MRNARRGVLAAAVVMAAVLALAGSALAMTAKPTIKSFAPTSGKEGTSVTITGTNLTGATVKFDGVKATTKMGSMMDTIDATVPAMAKTGKITVTTKGGTATSAKSFKVTM